MVVKMQVFHVRHASSKK